MILFVQIIMLAYELFLINKKSAASIHMAEVNAPATNTTVITTSPNRIILLVIVCETFFFDY
jgi:hypothetical protein